MIGGTNLDNAQFAPAPPPASYNKADYLVIADDLINNFTSAKNWLVPSYSGGIQTGFTSGKEFAELWTKFGKGKANDWPAANNGVIPPIPPTPRGVYAYPSSSAINNNDPDSDFTYSGSAISSTEPVVLFINGNLNINSNLDLGGKKVAFIVKKDIIVKNTVNGIDGVFFAGGEFSSGVTSGSGPPSGPLTSVVFFSGFETGNTGIGGAGDEMTGVAGCGGIQTTTVRSGARALRNSCQAISSTRENFAATTTVGWRFAFRTTDATPPAPYFYLAYLEENDGDGTLANATWSLQYLSDGRVRIQNRATGQNFDSANPVFSDNTWHLIEFKGIVNDTSGSLSLRVDGVEVVDQSGLDTNNGISRGIEDVIIAGPDNGSGVDYFFDDILVTDQAVYPGDGRIILKTTTVTGSTPTTGNALDLGVWQNTTEIPPAIINCPPICSFTTADYTGNPLSGSVDMADFAEIGQNDQINAVKVNGWMRRDSGAGTNHFLRMREGGANLDSPNLGLDTSFGPRDLLSATKPSGGAWTKAALDATEAGFGLSGAQDLFVDALYIQADYSPQGSGSCASCQLTVNGTVTAFGGFNLGRDLGSSNATTAAEVFNFDPSYLYLFAQIDATSGRALLGDPRKIFEEAPP